MATGSGNTRFTANQIAEDATAPDTLGRQIVLIGTAGVNAAVDVGAALGATNESAAATDTATSGHNGLLKRINQRLTTLIGLLPAALGANGGLKIEGVASGTPVRGVLVNNADGTVLDTNNWLDADAKSTSGYALKTLSGTYVFNGTTWDRARGDISNGLDVDPTRLPAGENHLGEVGGNSLPLSVQITGSTSPAYSLNDVVGGKLTLTSAMRKNNGSAVLQNFLLVDVANVKPPLTCLLFSRDPSNGTYTDNGAFTLNATDADFLIGAFPIGVSDWQQIGGTNLAIARPVDFQPIIVQASNNQANLYAVLIATATFTLTSTTQLRAVYGFSRD